MHLHCTKWENNA